MKPLYVLLSILVVLALVVLATLRFSATPRPVEGPTLVAGSSAEELAELRSEVAALTRRLDELQRERPLDSTAARTSALALPPSAVAPDGTQRDPRWFLEQYVLSYADGGEGSEYFRLAVDAYIEVLSSPVCELLRDNSRVAALRVSLAQMLGKRRFRGNLEVTDALVFVVRPPSPGPLALRSLDSLAEIGEPRVQSALEALLFGLQSRETRERALAVILRLAAEDSNGALLRLFARAPDDDWRRALIRMLDGSNLDAALQLLQRASTLEQPVRLEAAFKIGEYPGQEFRAYVAEWLRVETDAEVIEALHGAQNQQEEIPGWHAMKATGAPDADPRRDDQNAWASASGDMGVQWLELTYANPMRASAVRIYEVNSPGAVAEVKAKGFNGEWNTLWSGSANGNGAPLVIEFPLTSYDVKTVRIVLDTDRTPGWNEIDAVELVGSGPTQWAVHASASSTYGGGRVTQSFQIPLLEQQPRVFGGVRFKR